MLSVALAAALSLSGPAAAHPEWDALRVLVAKKAPALAGGPPAQAAAPAQPRAQPPVQSQLQGYGTPAPQHPALPRMEMQAQYAGPLQDTLIQRWRDPVDGTICYLYLPAIVAHSPPTTAGVVQYGANGIGSISCFAPAAATAAPR